jgi:hypothetical protein
MKRLDDRESVWLKAAIYGKPGTGKTSIGVSAPKPLILLAEAQGLVHVRQAAKRLGVPVPPTFLIESVDDYRAWLRALNGDRSKPLTVRERHTVDGKIEEIVVVQLDEWPETVVLDSLTEAGTLIVREIRWLSPPTKGKDGLPTDSQRFWNVLGDRFKALVHGFRDLPMHVLFLGLMDDRSEGEEDAKTRNVTMDLPMRKLPALVSSAVNVVGYSYRREVRKANKPTELQYGVMTSGPEYMMLKPMRPLRDTEVPNFARWVAAVRGHLADASPAPEPSGESLMAGDLEPQPQPTTAEGEPVQEGAAPDGEPPRAQVVDLFDAQTSLAGVGEAEEGAEPQAKKAKKGKKNDAQDGSEGN